MTDLDQTTHRLRTALDELVADVPAIAPPPRLSHGARRSPVPSRHAWGWRRPVALVSIAMAAAALLAAVVVFGPRSTAPRSAHGSHPVKPIGVRDAPPGWINLPMLLPSGAAVVDNATLATGPVPIPTTGTYEQVYEGSATTDPALLLITTVRAAPGALANYASGSQVITMDGTTAYMTNGSHHQLLWQTADGVVVSLESTGMSASDVLASGQLVEPNPATQLGVDLSGVLPDGLTFAGAGFSNGNTGQNQDSVFFHDGACHAYTTVWAGSAADFAPVVVVSDATRILSIAGTRVVSVQFGSTTSALLWNEEPGIDVRLQGGPGCDLTSIAAGMTVVDPAAWQSLISSLGSKAQTYTPHVPPTPAAPPGGGTFGLAH